MNFDWLIDLSTYMWIQYLDSLFWHHPPCFFFFFINHPILFTTAECPFALQTHGIVFPFVQYGVSHSICMGLPWKHLTFPAITIIILIIIIITSITKYSIMEAKESVAKNIKLNWVFSDCNGCIKWDLVLPLSRSKEGLLFPSEKPLRIFFISFKGNSRLNECLSVRVHGIVGVCVYVWLIHGMTKLAS